ncbi:MAG: 23S rRNA (pseudouridine(1915)-N(3))-methyltransferase RlmH [Oscillospiraceae bacterium]|nr:23S rRNA (pseudouridine(1915)-N(3))-methyltransferase RlmH [Oscillospiraceae bacterium]
MAVGKLKEGYFKEACAEYAKRLGAYCRLKITELPESRLSDNPSEKEIAAALENEGKQILTLIPQSAAVIPLCIEGTELSSEMLAWRLDKLMTEGTSCICFIIGSSYGLSDSVKKRAVLRLSMSPMTFPHRLARVMLLEQIYRSFSILGNGKYHK